MREYEIGDFNFMGIRYVESFCKLEAKTFKGNFFFVDKDFLG